jgi:hypothetical protein
MGFCTGHLTPAIRMVLRWAAKQRFYENTWPGQVQAGYDAAGRCACYVAAPGMSCGPDSRLRIG